MAPKGLGRSYAPRSAASATCKLAVASAARLRPAPQGEDRRRFFLAAAQVCKLVFKLWGDALRVTQLQLHNKKLRKLQEEAARPVEERQNGPTRPCSGGS